MIVLVRSIYRANKAKSKIEYLETFLDDFEILKLEIRLCVYMKILSIKKQSEIALLDTHACEGVGIYMFFQYFLPRKLRTHSVMLPIKSIYFNYALFRTLTGRLINSFSL